MYDFLQTKESGVAKTIAKQTQPIITEKVHRLTFDLKQPDDANQFEMSFYDTLNGYRGYATVVAKDFVAAWCEHSGLVWSDIEIVRIKNFSHIGDSRHFRITAHVTENELKDDALTTTRKHTQDCTSDVKLQTALDIIRSRTSARVGTKDYYDWGLMFEFNFNHFIIEFVADPIGYDCAEEFAGAVLNLLEQEIVDKFVDNGDICDQFGNVILGKFNK